MPGPLCTAKQIRILVALTLLAWATQTLCLQWARGQVSGVAPSQEKFVPPAIGSGAGATLELRRETTIRGSEIKLKQVCRWSEQDRAAFEPVADLVVARVQGDTPFQALSLEQIRQTLSDAGVNLSAIRFAGAMNCTVTRGDAAYDSQTALDQWIAAHQNTPPTSQPTQIVPAAPTQSITSPLHTLRDLLLADLAARLTLGVDSLEVHFNPVDEQTLNLSEPLFHFNVELNGTRDLGQVSWEVTIVPKGASTGKKVTIAALARA